MKLSIRIIIATILVALGCGVGFSRLETKGRGWTRETYLEQKLTERVRDRWITYPYSNPVLPSGVTPSSIHWQGYFILPVHFAVCFAVTSSGATELWVNDALQLSKPATATPERMVSEVALVPGDHKLQLKYFPHSGANSVTLDYRFGLDWLPLTSEQISVSPLASPSLRLLTELTRDGIKVVKVLSPFFPILAGFLVFRRRLTITNDAKVNALIVAALGGFFVVSAPRVASDGYEYYAYFRSLVFDGDLEFANEYTVTRGKFEYGPTMLLDRKTPLGYTINYSPIGPAVLWSPFLLGGLGFSYLQNVINPLLPFDGFSEYEVQAIGLGSLCYALAAVLLSYWTARTYFEARRSFQASVLAWLGTTLFFYAFFETSFAHAVSAFCVAWYVHQWLKVRQSSHLSTWFKQGLIGGFMLLVYWQNALLLVMGFGDLALKAVRAITSRQGKGLVLECVRCGLGLGSGIALVFLPQLLMWKILYGSFFAIPQGTSFILGAPVHFLEVFLSPNHGLFTWTPLTLMALWGFFGLARQRLGQAWYLMAIGFCLYVLHHSMMWDWYGGGAYGMRRFTNLYVYLALGLAAFWERYHRSFLANLAVILSIVWNVMLGAAYRSSFVGPAAALAQLLKVQAELSFSQILKCVGYSTYYQYWFEAYHRTGLAGVGLWLAFHLAMIGFLIGGIKVGNRYLTK